MIVIYLTVFCVCWLILEDCLGETVGELLDALFEDEEK